MIESAAAILGALSWGTLALIAGAAFIVAIFAGATGYGLGPVLILMLAPIVGVKAVLPVLAVTAAMNNIARVAAFWSGIHWKVAVLCMVTAVPGVMAGTLIYDRLSADAVALMLGVLLAIVMAGRKLPTGWLATARGYRLGNRGLLGVSACLGVISGAAANTGLLVMTMLLSAGIEGVALLGTKAALMVGMVSTRMAMFGGLDVLTGELALIGFIIGCVTVPGIGLSRLIVDRVPVHIHTWLLEAVIAGGALAFLWQGLWGYGLI
jgi:uncharacterized membrane protein YfcA